MPAEVNKVRFVPAGGDPGGEGIRKALLALFSKEVEAGMIETPIDDQQKKAWLGLIVPRIEEAYGVQVYTHRPERLAEALTRIREFCKTFRVNADEIVGEIEAIGTPKGAQ